MKVPAQWQRYAERIDAMTLRERLMIFLAAVLVLVWVLTAAFIDPLMSKQVAAEARVQQQQKEVAEQQARLTALSRARSDAGSAQAANNARVDGLKARLEALNRDIGEKERQLVRPEQMIGLVADLVRRNRGVQLVALKNIPPEQLSQGASALYRHGVEVTVSGSFADLMSYLGDFERIPLRVSWGRLDLDATQYPNVSMELVLTTLSTSKPWLQI